MSNSVSGLIFQQLFEPESSTYTYLLADADSKEAVLIDPVLETLERDLKLLQDLGLTLKYALETHLHADHITGGGMLRERTGARTGIAAAAGVSCADLALKDGDEIAFGRHRLRVIATPGHTDSCLTYQCGDKLFTGDSLMIGAAGRTDFQQGSAKRLYDSITGRLFVLPPETEVYPAHDYKGRTKSTIADEMKSNARIGGGRSEQEFVRIMSELDLAPPKKIAMALPANRECGMKKSVLSPTESPHGVPEISAEQLHPHLGRVRLIDVRTPEEFTGELGHIPGAELQPLGPELLGWLETQDRAQEMVFICRVGGRSAQATMLSRQMGFQKTINMAGGMMRWNELKYVTEK